MGTTNPCRFSKQFLYGIIVVLFIANGLNAELCRKGCPKSDMEKLKYLPGNVYEYKFDSIIKIGINNDDGDETSLKLTGNANIYSEGNCGYTLKLDKINVQTTRESLRKQITNGINKPVQFTLTNGELDTKICTDQNDNEYGLNIKRAIISLLQSTDINQKYETDIFGVCPTLKTIDLTTGNIIKTRNLNLCKYRENIISGLMTGIITDKSNIKSSQYLLGDYIKKQNIVNGIYDHIELNEMYKFNPIPNNNNNNNVDDITNNKNIINVNVNTNMKLITNGPSQQIPQLNKNNIKLNTIIFQNPSSLKIKNLDITRKQLDKTINLLNVNTKSDSASNFNELIRLMRYSDYDTLIELSLHQHQNKNLARKVYFDALFRVSTSESVKAIINQIPKMNDKEKRLAYISFNLVTAINKEALVQVATLLTPNTPREAYLSIGHLINIYCKKENCDDSKEINVISKKLIDNLKECKPNTKQDEDRYIGILKGIRNTNIIIKSSVQQLLKCVQNDRSNRLRVAALQSFTASNCNDNLQNEAMKILKDYNEDSEIRIEAYLIVVQCPNINVANELSNIINNEMVNQVGGFITSHLKSIRDSTDFTRESQRYHLSNIRITKKFPIDPKRYSFNNELSYAIESLGAGTSIDYNVIYSQNGFLPRSGRFNLTNVIYGQSFNTFELNVRQENLENILEYYFGPKGFLNKEPQDIFDQLFITDNNNNEKRNKRNINDDTTKVSKKYKTYGYHKLNNDINLDLSIKLFGSELTFLSLGNNIPTTADELINEFSKLFMNIKNGIKNYNNLYEYHSMFYDLEYVYPTGIGLPLEIIGQGTTTGKFDVSTNINIDNILDNPKNSKFHIKFIPTINMNLNGKLLINGGVLSTGLLIQSNLYSTSGGDVKLDIINDGNGFNLDLNLPNNNIELIELKHNIDFYISEQDKELKLLPFKINIKNKRKQNIQPTCFDQLQIFGLTVCYKSYIQEQSNLLYPLNGPIHIDLVLQTERNINIKGFYNVLPTHQQWELLFDTPNSQKSHKTKLQFDLGVKPKLYTRLNFNNPDKQLAIETGIQNDNKEFNIYGQIEIDNDITLRKIGFHKNGNEYTPMIQMSGRDGIKNDIGGYKADGKVIVSKVDNSDTIKYDFQNFRLIRPNNELTTINGWIINDNGFKSLLNIQDGIYNYKIDSHCNIDSDNGFSIGAFVTNNDKPDITNGGSLLLNVGDKMLKHQLKIQAGENQFYLHNEYNCNDDKPQYLNNCKFINDINLKNKNNIILSGKLNGEFNDNIKNYEFELIHNDKRISINQKLQYDIKIIGNYDLNINMKLNRHFIDIKSKNIIKNNKNIIDNILITSWGTKLIIKGELNNNIKLYDSNINLNGIIQISPKDNELIWLLKLLNTNDKHKSEFKLTNNNNKIDIIQYNCDINKSIENNKLMNGNIDIKILDLLLTNGNFKYNKNGNGDLSLLINLIKSKNIIKFDTKYLISSPKYDIDTSILFNNDKKIIYKTENIFDNNKYSTKNQLDIGNDKLIFNSNGHIKGNHILYDSDIDGKFDLILPTGRKINGQLKRKISLKNKNGNIDIILQDEKPNNQKRSITIKGQLTDYNYKLNLFNLNYNIVYNDFNDKTLNTNMIMKNLQLNDKYNMGKYSIELFGTLLPEKINANIDINEYCPMHSIFNINGKYGNKINWNINGNYQLIDNTNNEFKYDLKTSINIPNNQYKLYTIETNGKYIQPINDNDIYNTEFNILYKYDNNELKLNSYIKGNDDTGEYMIETNCPWHNTILLKGNYLQQLTNNNNDGKYQYKIQYKFDKNINIDTEFNLDYQSNNIINLNYILKTNYDQAKLIQITFNGIDNTEHNQYKLLTIYNYKNNIYNFNTDIDVTENKNMININYKTPTVNGKLSGFTEFKTYQHLISQLILDNFIGIDLISNGEINYNELDEFNIKFNMNSKKFKLNNLLIELNSLKSTTTDKKINININNNNENIINGIAQFNIKQEKLKTIIEGQGTIKYYKNDYNANIKLINQIYNDVNDNENGISYNFIGKFGQKNIVSTIKLTTKNFHINFASCEEKKQCTNFEIKSVITTDKNDLTQGQHKLLILINLLELGYPYEFELTSKTTYKGYKVLHEIDMNIISNNNNKYEFSANIQPQQSLIKLKLPKRSILFEIVNNVPKNNYIFGKYENSITFYFDKDNKPNDKTQLLFINNIGGIKNNAVNSDFQIKLQHPTIRPLSINGKFELNQHNHLANSYIEFDIFKQSQSKIVGEFKLLNYNLNNNGYNLTTETQLFSNGLGFKYLMNTYTTIIYDKLEFATGTNIESNDNDIKFSTYIHGNRNKFDLIINGFNYELVKLNCQLNLPSNKIKIVNKLQLLNTKPIEMLCELEPRGGKFMIKRNNMFDATGEMKIGKDATFIVNGYGKKLYNGKIMLDTANLLTTTYEVEDENIRSFLHDAEIEYNKDRQNAIEEIDKKFQKFSNAMGQRLQSFKSNLPDFTKLHKNYEQNINSIVKELEEDPALRDIIEFYQRLYDMCVKFITELEKTITELYIKIQESVLEFYEKLTITIKEQILPIVKEFLTKLTEIFSDLYTETMKIIGTIFERALKSLHGFKEYLNELSKPFAELLKPIVDILNQLFKNILKEWEEFWNDIDEYWNKLPSIKEFFNNMYNKIIKLHNIDELLNILREIFNHLEQWTISKEGQEFLDKLYKYIENKLRNNNINDIHAIEELYYSFIKAIQSIIKQLSDNLIDTNISSPISYLLQPLPFTYDTLIKLPTWIEFKFSPFNYLRNEKFNIFKELLLYQSPTLDIIPPYDLYGHISDGQHIFTFDGKHITLPGNCKYILAQDYINNNFSVIANLNNGKMKSIILIDKHNYIEINDKSQIKLNDKLTEYPVHNNDIHAWRRYYTVSILSKYGVKVMCSSDLRVCHVIVNGYYTSKLRGLLGNGNSEQYDDFTKIDGTITDNYAEFGNNYGLGNCQPITLNPSLISSNDQQQQITDHHQHHHQHDNNQICNELFNYESNLLFGYLFINPIKYREACNHAVLLAKTNKLDAACNIALTYASSARINELPVYIPDECLQCKVNDKQYKIGDEYKSHTPNNQVDLVFIVDTSLDKTILNQFVQNILKDIREQLKQRGLININLSVIGYNDKQIYPQLYTTNGKYKNFDPDTLLKMNMNGPEHEHISNVGIDKINDLLSKLQTVRELLQETGAEALELALKYPFRSGAAKSIIVINNDSLEDFGSLINDFGTTVSSYLLQKKGLSFHYIGNVEELSVDNLQTEKIVGFNKRAVATLDGKDAKKRSKLHYTSNMAIETIQENYGWIFALQNYNHQTSQENKMKFIQQITSSIADQLFKTTIDYNCKCTTAYGLHAEEECVAVSTTFDANKKPK